MRHIGNMKIIYRDTPIDSDDSDVVAGISTTKTAARDVYSIQACDVRDDDKDGIEAIVKKVFANEVEGRGDTNSIIEDETVPKEDRNDAEKESNNLPIPIVYREDDAVPEEARNKGGIADALSQMIEEFGIADALSHMNEEFTKSYEEMAAQLKNLDESTAAFVAMEEAEDTTLAVFGKETADAIEYALWQAHTLVNDDTYFDLDNASTFSDTTCATRSCYTRYTDATRCTTNSWYSGVTEASAHTAATNATGLRSEKNPAVEVLYNKKAGRILGIRVTKKTGLSFQPLLSNM